MITCIVGNKGKGKTKHLLELTRLHLKDAKGSVIYIDKTDQRIFELDSSIRLINASDYQIDSTSKFLGFLLGILSINHDIELLILDSLLTISSCTIENLGSFINEVDAISKKFHVDFIMSISEDKSKISNNLSNCQIISL